MKTLNTSDPLPIYSLKPDHTNTSAHFKVYNFEGNLPEQADLLVPHRKDHYLFVFMRRGGGRIWVDMVPYVPEDQCMYFITPGQVIVKEGTEELWSTGIAFTPEFLSLHGGSTLADLPVIQNPHSAHKLLLSETDILFVEDMLDKINTEYHHRSEWQQRMLSAYLTLLLTYLSRLYTAQYTGSDTSVEKLLLKKFQTKIAAHFQQYHEVGDYAAMLHISAGHLSEAVKARSGKPAIKHIHERLILEARRLLFHTDQSLKEITFNLGFSDTSYFNRFFKRETGETPAVYRSLIRKIYH